MAAHTYWRLYITATQTFGFVAITEVKMYDAGSTLLSTGGTPSVSSFLFSDPTYNAAKAFDSNTSTFWNSNAEPAVFPQWIAYQMPAPGDVASFSIQARNDSNYFQSPSVWTLQSSDDGSSWSDVQAYTSATWTAAGQTQTFTVTAGALLLHPGMEGMRPLMTGGMHG
jgi:hypothetical protein